MKLFASHTSPFARKVRVLLAEKAIAHELREDNVWAAGSEAARHNPLGKIPVLVLGDGTALYDSSVITEYLDTLPGPPMIPAAGMERARARCLESLADGICDAAVAIVLERRRESARQDPAWITRQRGKVEEGVAELARALGGRGHFGGDSFGLADIAAGTALGYLDFRHGDFNWRGRHPGLSAWAAVALERPSFVATRPPAG